MEAKSNGKARLHNVRFYTIKPRAIVCMAHSNFLNTLAVSREDGDIELWNMNDAPYMDRVIHLTPETAVEDLAWADDRLFSVGLSGKLIQWDVNTLQPRCEQSPTGNALWCLDVNKAQTELAVGSEEGHINIMSIENNEISYKTLFNKQVGRVLCCRFNKPGRKLITGSMGVVRIWSVRTGTVLHTMTLSSPTIIAHSVMVCKDETIIAGDSAGYVTVWSCENGTQLESNQVLDRNIFALAMNDTENILVCGGKEPTYIRVLIKTQIKREDALFDRWIKYIQREPHQHYVKSLLVLDDSIISGGDDGILCISTITKTQGAITKYGPFPLGPVVSVASEANLMLLRYPRSLHLWRLGEPRQEGRNQRTVGGATVTQLKKTPDKLIQLNIAAEKFIQAAALSPDSKWICYSTGEELRLSRLQLDPIGVKRVTENLPAELEVASHISFSKTNQLFLLHAESRQLRCFNFQNEDDVEFLYAVNLSAHVKSHVNHVAISPCGSYFAVATLDHFISIWKLNGNESKHLVNLPRYRAATTALALHENNPRVVVSYADARIVDYDFLECRFVCESGKHYISSNRSHVIKGLLLDAKNPTIVIAFNERYLYVLKSIERTAKVEKSPNNKMKRMSIQEGNDSASHALTYKLKSRFERNHLVDACRLGDKQLVTVSIQPQNLIASLPPPYVRKKYGVA